ncbi:S-adenosylmethionine-dependent methyltransferase [Aspergillus nanangensis]|uniref:S-adenosylmethionine-dependent methyltransferase n=1 Tax=Aspergillus nanangensis TaxID=2582783 RepID=A0AAD4GQG7_ASPNN|nr:S-adenosylmethionine-dependent methyltransferase [Aspergillus nanangensis]
MLPTPCTSHVSFDTIYEPSEDSYLFLDTLSSASESLWLTTHFHPAANPSNSTAPLIVEVGSGSGIVLSFVAANSLPILGRRDVLALATDVNRNACVATRETATKAITDRQGQDPTTPTTIKSTYIASLMADLVSPLRPGSVDILLFNPPYVPTEELPRLPSATEQDEEASEGLSRSARFERESYLLSLTYAGGRDGMETTDRLVAAIPDILAPRGVAYVLLCAQNRPVEVRERIRAWGGGWNAELVGSSGVQAGWEKLVIARIWRDV